MAQAMKGMKVIKNMKIIAKKNKKIEISPITGLPKRIRRDNGREAAAKAATMTKDGAQWPKPKYMSEPREMVYVRDGGDGAYRQKTYEIVTRWTAKTKIEYRPHAKAPGSKSHIRYEKYSKAKTVGEALALGCYPVDWCFDYEHGFIRVKGGEIREDSFRVCSVQEG
eukprot:g2679.t1